MKPVRKSVIKLRKLKEIRRKNLEKNFLEIQMKGQDHYIFINERGKAQVVTNDGNWVSEHIRTAEQGKFLTLLINEIDSTL